MLAYLRGLNANESVSIDDENTSSLTFAETFPPPSRGKNWLYISVLREAVGWVRGFRGLKSRVPILADEQVERQSARCRLFASAARQVVSTLYRVEDRGKSTHTDSAKFFIPLGAYRLCSTVRARITALAIQYPSSAG